MFLETAETADIEWRETGEDSSIHLQRQPQHREMSPWSWVCVKSL